MFQTRPAHSAPASEHPIAQFPPADPVSAQALIDEKAGWLPQGTWGKTAYFSLFRLWHGRVRAEYTAHATPHFLFLLAMLPVLTKARDELKSMTLWDPPAGPLKDVRDGQPAWRQYSAFLPRIEQTVAEVGPYSEIKLPQDLDHLLENMTVAESAFREGPPA